MKAIAVLQAIRPFASTCLTLGAALVACTYDPPPDVSLDVPETGVFVVGDTLHLTFSEPIATDTLGIRVWHGQRDLEGTLTATAPMLDVCRPAQSPCGTTQLAVEDGGFGAVVTLAPEDLGQPDVPLVLEVVPGLEDAQGNATGATAQFDFQFKPVEDVAADPVAFEEGVYIIVASIEEPLPAILTLISDFETGPSNHIAAAGAEGDEIGDAPRNTQNPEELMIDTTENGFTIHATGRIREVEGERFVELDPFPVVVTLGPITVNLNGVRLDGLVVLDEAAGHDRLEGTLSYEGVLLDTGDGTPFEYEGGNVAFSAPFVPAEVVPEGTPSVCDAPCGAVIPDRCDVPEDFPPEDVCQ